MGLIASVRKAWRLRRIAKTLGAPLDASRMVSEWASGRPSRRHRALDALLNLCEADPLLRGIIAERHSDREQLREVYQVLCATGAGQWAGGHFVPASALTSPYALDFVLENAGKLPWPQIAVLLIEHFERNDVAPVPHEPRGPSDPGDPLNALWEMEQRAKGRR